MRIFCFDRVIIIIIIIINVRQSIWKIIFREYSRAHLFSSVEWVQERENKTEEKRLLYLILELIIGLHFIVVVETVIQLHSA